MCVHGVDMAPWVKVEIPKARCGPARSGLLLAFSVGFTSWPQRHAPASWPPPCCSTTAWASSFTSCKALRAWTTAWGGLQRLGLAAFKYAFFIDDTFGLGLLASGTFRLDAWMLPLGHLVFHVPSHQLLGRRAPTHTGHAPDLLSFATYLTFFPQLVAGPIVRATSFLPQLASPTWNTAPLP